MSFDPTLPRTGSARTDIATSSPPAARSTELRRRLAKTDSAVPSIGRPRGASYRHVVDWEHVGLVGAGLLIGALVGAGAALLLAPQSGAEARTAIRRKAHLARHRAGDAWDDLANELAGVARRGRRRARRALKRARWRASDAIA